MVREWPSYEINLHPARDTTKRREVDRRVAVAIVMQEATPIGGKKDGFMRVRPKNAATNQQMLNIKTRPNPGRKWMLQKLSGRQDGAVRVPRIWIYESSAQ